MKPALTSSAPPDPTVYPVEDDVGEEIIQRMICELLRPLIERYLKERATQALVGADQFVYYRRGDPKACVSPDVYVMPGVPQETEVTAWKVWEHHVIPSFALEVVADHRRKDYEESPARHAELGTRELVVFDPHAHERRGRVRFQLFRRSPRRGFGLVLATDGDRIQSRSLGCWIRAVGEGPALRLRIAEGRRGQEPYPTDAERAERAEAELAKLRAEIARARER